MILFTQTCWAINLAVTIRSWFDKSSFVGSILSFSVNWTKPKPGMGRNSGCVKQKLRKGLWSPEEDEKLYNYITRFGVGCWSSVPKLAGHSFFFYQILEFHISSRYISIPAYIIEGIIHIHVLIHAGLQRCGKSCRLRWINYLRPDLKRGMFSQEEEDLILNLHEALGNRFLYSQLHQSTN